MKKSESSFHCDTVHLHATLHIRTIESRQCEVGSSSKGCVIDWSQTVCSVKAESKSHVLKRDLPPCIVQTNSLDLRCLPAGL